MPHRTQVYGVTQRLDLRTGVLATKGVLYLGSEVAWRAGLKPERCVRFTVRAAALKDSEWLCFEVSVEYGADIAFLLEHVTEEGLTLGGKAKDAHKLGNEIDCDLRQRVSSVVAEAGRIAWTAESEGGETLEWTRTAETFFGN